MAKALLMSESNYNRKENGQLQIELHEAIKIAKLLNLNEKVVQEYWVADRLYELMKKDKDIVYDALKLVELNFENYDKCVEMPSKNCSFSSISERLQHRKKK